MPPRDEARGHLERVISTKGHFLLPRKSRSRGEEEEYVIDAGLGGNRP